MTILEIHDSEIDVDAIMATIRERIASRAKATDSSMPTHHPTDSDPFPKPLQHLDVPIKGALHEADQMKVIYQLSLDEPSRTKRAIKRFVRAVVDTPFFRFLTIKQVVVNRALIQAITFLHEKAQALDAVVQKAQEDLVKQKADLEATCREFHNNLERVLVLQEDLRHRLEAVEGTVEERHAELAERLAGHDERFGAVEKAGEERHAELAERLAGHDERLGAVEKAGEERHAELAERLAGHDERFGAVEKAGEERHAELAERLAGHDERFGAVEKAVEERHAELIERLASHDERLGTAVRTLRLLEKDQQILKRRLELFVRQLKSEQALEPVATETEERLTDLTLALLLERFRGSRHQIKKRQAIYLPYLDNLPESLRQLPILDLGAGRGEFVELLQERGFQAKGIECNELLVQECQERNLPVRQGDALAALRELSDESVAAICALQVIEHFERPIIWEFIKLCFDKLTPEGLLILETINPESLTAAVINFNKDFTHTHPLHPDATQFLMEQAGFTDMEIQLLHPYEKMDILQLIPKSARSSSHVDIMNRNFKRLNDLLFGYQDYAILGRK